MSSIMRYIKMQLKEKVVSHSKMSFLSFISPVVFFLVYFLASKIMGIGKENDQRISTIQCIFLTTTIYLLYIIMAFNAAYDLINEKKKFRKQHMYAHGFSLTKFHISWTIIYALLILPTCLVIVVIIYLAKIFPGVNIVLLFLTLYLPQVSTATLSFWLSSYFSNPIRGGFFSVLVQIIIILSFFFKSFISYANNNYNDKLYINTEYAPTDKIIWIYKDAVNKNETVGFSNLFTKKYIWVFIYLSIIFASIFLFILFAIWSDAFYISSHVKRGFSERKNQSYYKGLIINGPHTKVKQVSCNEVECDEGFFDWNEMRQLFKANKDKYKTVYEEVNDNIQQDIDKNGKEMISIKNLFKKYGNSNELAINNVSFKVYSNEIIIITGKPDSGKSTLMRMLYGRQSSSYGNIIIKGNEMNNSNWKTINKDISVAPKEDYMFMENLSVSDNIKLYSSMCSTREKGISILNELNFKGNSSDLIKNLDDVEKTKVKIALALLKSKPCIFIEEPTALMSENDSACFWNVIKSRKNKKSIIISTSSMYEALTHGDRIVVLKDGMTQCIGNREFVKNRLSNNENEPELEIRINNY